MILTRQWLSSASSSATLINAAASADSADKGLATLRLIEDRLHRDSFRKICDDFEKRLSSAAQKMTVREPGSGAADRGYGAIE